MTFEIDCAGRLHVVTLEPEGGADASGGRFRVRLRGPEGADGDVSGERALAVDVRRTDLGYSLVFDDGRSLDAAVTERPGGDVLVQLPHVDVVATVDGRRLRRGGPAAAGGGGQHITAPMPGRVLRVLVAVGDEVVERQGLVVIEAMKMENQLSATRPGRVAEVTVTAGSTVESGRLLVVIAAP